MSNNDYKISRKKISSADDFELLILVLPEDEVEDKLAYLAREKGQITKIFYEDLIIATCVANINQLVFATSNQNENLLIMAKIRDEVVEAIVDANPALNPKNLILNRNHVVKIKKGDLSDGEKLLVDNKFWDAPISEMRSPESPNESKKSVKDGNEKPSKNKGQRSKKELKNPSTLEHTIVKKWWKRIGQYVSIKKFEAEYAEDILRQRYFHNRTSFGTFIVATCVVDFEELFSMLDNMGIPNRVAPPLLMHELYELCVSVNDFLTFENAQSMFDEDAQPADEDKECASGKKCSTAGSNSMSAMAKGKKKKGFRDVQKEDLLRLADSMKVSLIGQNEAVDCLANAIQRASVGLKDPDKPIGSFLFAGTTGCGKSLASKVLADELIKDRNNLVVVDCSEYSADHEYSKLIGSPQGYVGHEQGGYLTNAVAKSPFSVIVFDEIEKASKKVHELLLQVLDEGRLTDGKGKTVSFKDTVIILTSNIGVSEIDKVKKTIGFGDVNVLTEKKKGAALEKALKDKFKPEFINRLDEIIYFKTLADEDYMRIIDIELYKLNDNLKNNDTEYKDVEIDFDANVRKVIFKHGIDKDFGARPLKRCIERLIATPLARELLTKEVIDDIMVKVTANKKEDIVFKFKKVPVNPPAFLAEESACATCIKE
jgi:ATP-dependent Clp protease ATP-binding subunit ClpA